VSADADSIDERLDRHHTGLGRDLETNEAVWISLRRDIDRDDARGLQAWPLLKSPKTAITPLETIRGEVAGFRDVDAGAADRPIEYRIHRTG
jgi:hypothetical protein